MGGGGGSLSGGSVQGVLCLGVSVQEGYLSLSGSLCNRDLHPLPLVDRMTDACENITLSQTSFAGGQNG